MRGQVKVESLKKAYTWIIVLLPLLSVYGWAQFSLDIGTLLVAIVFCVLFLISKKRIKARGYLVWYVYIAYIIAGEIVFCLVGNAYQSPLFVVFRTVKYLLYIVICIISVSNQFCDYGYMVKCYMKVAKMATTYIILQTLFHYLFGINLWGHANCFLFEPAYVSRLGQVISGMYRPTSLFYEPAHYFEYVFFGIVILLFAEGGMGKKVFQALYISFGILLSTSSQGIVCVAGIWGVWILKCLMKSSYKKSVPRILPVIILGGICAAVVFVMSSLGQAIIERTVNPNVQGGNALIGRMGTYLELVKLSFEELFWGTGYGNIISGFFANWAYNLWCLGIVGTIIVVGIYISCYRKAYRAEIKILIMLHAVLCLFGTLFMGKYMLFYFVFVLCGNARKEVEV